MDLAITPEQWPSCISNTASLWHCDLSGGLQSQEKCFPLVCLGRSCCSQSSVKITIIVVSLDCRRIISSPLFLNVYQSSFQFKWFFECRFHGSRSACISEELDALVFFPFCHRERARGNACLMRTAGGELTMMLTCFAQPFIFAESIWMRMVSLLHLSQMWSIYYCLLYHCYCTCL